MNATNKTAWRVGTGNAVTIFFFIQEGLVKWKLEIRNPKSEINPNFQVRKSAEFGFPFGFRISGFGFPVAWSRRHHFFLAHSLCDYSHTVALLREARGPHHDKVASRLRDNLFRRAVRAFEIVDE